MLPATIKPLLQPAGQIKEQSYITITRGMQPSRPPFLKMKRYTTVEEEDLSVKTLHFVFLP